MNELFNTALTNISEELTVLSELTTIATALILGSIIAVTYRKTQDEEFYPRSLAVTLFMLPVILSAIILFVGSSIAHAGRKPDHKPFGGCGMNLLFVHKRYIL